MKPYVLQALTHYPHYDLIITGHSLGAGTTCLLSLLWLSDPEIMEYGFRSIAYAPPPTISKELVPFMKDYVTSVVYGNDVVPRLSFGSLMDMSKVVVNLH